MPAFPEKDSLLLSKLYKTAPWMAKLHESSTTQETELTIETKEATPQPATAGGDPTDPIYGKPRPNRARHFGPPLTAQVDRKAKSKQTTPPAATPIVPVVTAEVATPPSTGFDDFLVDIANVNLPTVTSLSPENEEAYKK